MLTKEIAAWGGGLGDANSLITGERAGRGMGVDVGVVGP